MESKVLEFIHRRFPKDCNWTNGNCYYFARILEDRFEFIICYDQIAGHFVAVDEYTGIAYDWNGIYNSKNPLISMWDLACKDPLLYHRLIRDCID